MAARLPLLFFLMIFVCRFSLGQQQPRDATAAGPAEDICYRVIWLIESDDANRLAYDGPAREGLTTRGYGRLVPAGSAAAIATIGKRSTVTGFSRCGQMSVSASFLNTTESGQVQADIRVGTKSPSLVSIDTVVRVPMGRWFLLGSTDSRIGLPQHAADGKRSVVVMRVDDGVLLLD
jgi:hypothetical protein